MLSLLKKVLRKVYRRVIHTLKDSFEKTVTTKSKELNRMLYEDVDKIDKLEMQTFVNLMMRFAIERGYAQEYTESWKGHAYRLYLSIEWIREIIKGMNAPHIVAIETGGDSIFTDLLKCYFPEVEWINTNFDLRHEWTFPENYADVIICTEVLEHLSDIPEGFQDTFLKTGLTGTLAQAFRVLKPGGSFFVTTPNAASVVTLHTILSGYGPWFYNLHLREYTLHDLRPEFEKAGFALNKYRAIHCLSAHLRNDYSWIYRILLENSLDITNRGDDLFIIAAKP